MKTADGDCKHPLAARKVEVYAVGPMASDRRLRTACWVCQIEKEIAAKEKRDQGG